MVTAFNNSTLPIGFLPDSRRAVALYCEMKTRLIDSLSYLHQQLSDTTSQPPPIDSWLATLNKTTFIKPGIFGYYYDLASALLQDDIELAKQLFTKLSSFEAAASGLSVITLSETDLDRESINLYIRNVEIEPDVPLHLTAPSASSAERVSTHIHQALEIIDQVLPELGEEIRALTTEIVMASSAKNSAGITFHGASSVYLWGTLFINADYHKTLVQVLDTLIHESAHCLLFGLSVEGPLVENPEQERHSSPLREDLRPIDGIYHATFVLSRMHYGMQNILDSGLLDEESNNAVERLIGHHASCFRDGLNTIESVGRLTQLGSTILQGPKQYMQSVGAI